MKTNLHNIRVTAVISVFIGTGFLHPGCIDRYFEQNCPVTVAVFENAIHDHSALGIDLLLVVDNSASMKDKQETVSSAVVALVESLINPDPNDNETVPAPVDNVRVAVVTSDLGLMYGYDHSLYSSDEIVLNCSDPDGDNGAFQTVSRVREDACLKTEGDLAETSALNPNASLSDEAACMAGQGASGCEVEQTLEAALLALNTHEELSISGNLLAVIVFSDEDDFSIGDAGLFETEMWQGSPNIAGSYPEENGQFLFSADAYSSRIQAGSDTFFGAVAGVPAVNVCRGSGEAVEAEGCLDLSEMRVTLSDDKSDTGEDRLVPACFITDPVTFENTGNASPGRRFVEVAESFGKSSYVSSICDNDIQENMKEMARGIWDRAFHSSFCQSRELSRAELPSSEQPEECGGHCGVAEYSAKVEFYLSKDAADTCPDNLYQGWSEEDRQAFQSQRTVTPITDDQGIETGKTVHCPLSTLPLPLDCGQAETMVRDMYSDRSGWYYCESSDEDDIASDCSYQFRYTDQARAATIGYYRTTLYGLQQFEGDENCE